MPKEATTPGSMNYFAKLTEEDVMLIRELIKEREEARKKASSLSNKKIAEKFEVSQWTINLISAGRTWTHVF